MNGSDDYTEYDKYKVDIGWAFHHLNDNYTVEYKMLIAWRTVMKILDKIESKCISDEDKNDLQKIVDKLIDITDYQPKKWWNFWR